MHPVAHFGSLAPSHPRAIHFFDFLAPLLGLQKVGSEDFDWDGIPDRSQPSQYLPSRQLNSYGSARRSKERSSAQPANLTVWTSHRLNPDCASRNRARQSAVPPSLRWCSLAAATARAQHRRWRRRGVLAVRAPMHQQGRSARSASAHSGPTLPRAPASTRCHYTSPPRAVHPSSTGGGNGRHPESHSPTRGRDPLPQPRRMLARRFERHAPA